MSKVLLLEDDHIIANQVRDFLVGKGIKCEVAYDGELFFRQKKSETYDLYLLDINVPKMNGLDVCRRIRETDKLTAILMLTAFGEIEDKVDAFKSGADDYLVKPFHLDELYIRIQALLRRKLAPQNEHNTLNIADLSIEVESKTVNRAGVPIKLTPKEFNLLRILANAKGRVLSKQQIADELWDYYIETNENTIEVYINFLRNKIDKPFGKALIHTKVGFGYYLKEEE